MEKAIKLISYNIDGLPETLDLNDLPWILKPIAWIYKLIKGTTIVTINDGGHKQESITNISKKLSKSDADIIAVQEDFNYHDELMSSLSNYKCGTYSGGFDLSHLFSSTEWYTYFPLPRFKADGINIIAKDKISFSDEKIVRWKKSYGYFTHANDLLTHKGFRLYKVTIDENAIVDLYILHMDADFYNPDKCPDVSKDVDARKKQLEQLTKHIIEKREGKNPVIIIGDTNSSVKYEWDIENIENNLLKPINEVENLNIKEIIPEDFKDVDRVFFINDKNSDMKIKDGKCYYDKNYTWEYGRLSDHYPLMVELTIENKKN